MKISGPAKRTRQDWERIYRRLTEHGWSLRYQRLFRPLFGSYWRVEASHIGTDRHLSVEGPTLKIALKKVEARAGG